MKRILACLDSSPRAALVLTTAADLAQRTGARLSLLRTVGIPAEIDQELLVHAASTVLESMTARAAKEMNDLAATLPPALVDGVYVHVGTPWDTICREAKAHDVDLVVVGSHGYSGMDRILGTTASKVVNRCERSVLVVRATPGANS